MRSLPEMPCDTDTFEKEQTFLGSSGARIHRVPKPPKQSPSVGQRGFTW
jgi:hypothetical protein